MECDNARAAISARIDGEDPGLPGDALDAHLGGCAACRGWQQRAHTVTRRARLGGPFLDHDLTAQVLAACPAGAAGAGVDRRRTAQRAALLAVAVAQLAITVPLLILGHEHGAGTHAAHELGSFDLALAVAFSVGAIRPALSAGLAWPCGIAAAGLLATATVSLVSGQAIGADDGQHLIAVAGATLLCWQARTCRAETAGAALGGAGVAGARDGDPAWPDGIVRLDGPPDPPGGGAAARQSTRPARRGRDGSRDGNGTEAVA